MTLIAIDGSWARDTLAPGDETNVSRIARAYRGDLLYLDGVGSRRGLLQKMLGGAFGVGARDRVNDAITQATMLAQRNGGSVDLVGWSRGAAMCIHLAHELHELGIHVRFIGLLDPVAMFGAPGRYINWGWKLRTPPADRVVVVYALDERSMFFPPVQVDGVRYWVPGTHADVGRKGQALTVLATELGFVPSYAGVEWSESDREGRRPAWGRTPREGDIVIGGVK